MKRYLTLGIILYLIWPVFYIEAQELLSMEVQVGFDSYYKIEAWTPIRVTVENQGADIRGQIQIFNQKPNFSSADILYTYPVELPSQSRKQINFYMPLRGKQHLTVNLVDEQGTSILTEESRIDALNANAFLVGVVAKDHSLLNSLVRHATPEGEVVAVAHLSLEDLPANPQGWQALDMVVFNQVDSSLLTPEQQEALYSWVRFGGRLVVGGGPNASQTIAGLTSLLPFSGVTIENLTHPLPSLEKLIGHGLTDRGPYVAAVPNNPTGEVKLREKEFPLIITFEPALGQVIYLAFDLNLAPLDAIQGELSFLSLLGDDLQSKEKNIFAEQTQIRRIRESLALIPGQALPTPWTVGLYLLIYILMLGPFNYFILTRTKRRDWAWFTIPLIILLFSAYGYISGFRLRRGRALVRQITVIQPEFGTPLANVTSFIGLYSPYRTSYQLEIADSVQIEALPDNLSSNQELQVIENGSTTIDNIRGDIGSISGVIAHTYIESPNITTDLAYYPSQGTVEGTITNHMSQPLKDVLLVIPDFDFNERPYFLSVGEIPPDSKPISVQGTVEQPNYTETYYNFDEIQDQERRVRLGSRYETLRALFEERKSPATPFNPNQNQAEQKISLSNQLYLAGWLEGSALPISLVQGQGDYMNESLLIVRVTEKE